MASVYRRKGDKRFCIGYRDHTGKRRMIRTNFRLKQDARAHADKLEREAEQLKRGLIELTDLRIAEHALRPVQEHVEEYVADLAHTCTSADHVKIRRSILEKMVDFAAAATLADLFNPNGVARYLQARKAAGRSAATVNHDRAAIIAFANWCVSCDRIRSNPLKKIGKLNEDVDRRRVRRALTADELDRLLLAARERDALRDSRTTPRFPVYLTAALTGLRRSELKALTWDDVDLERAVIVIPAKKGKAKRDDVIELHRNVVEVLTAMRPANARGRVFAKIPRIKTVYKDLARAVIPKQDEDGRWVDLHALRTTLGTELALSGVSVAETTRLMRHADNRVTQRHYFRPVLRNDAAAINRLPDVLERSPAARAAASGEHIQCNSAQAAATESGDAAPSGGPNHLTNVTLRNTLTPERSLAQPTRNAAKTGAISSVGYSPSDAPDASKSLPVVSLRAAAKVVAMPPAANAAALENAGHKIQALTQQMLELAQQITELQAQHAAPKRRRKRSG